MKKKRIFVRAVSALTVLACACSIMVFSPTKIYAGDINENEQRIISFMNKVFTYNGKEYVATEEAKQIAINKLMQDDVDLTAAQVTSYIRQASANISLGISRGYLVLKEPDEDPSTEEPGTEEPTTEEPATEEPNKKPEEKPEKKPEQKEEPNSEFEFPADTELGDVDFYDPSGEKVSADEFLDAIDKDGITIEQGENNSLFIMDADGNIIYTTIQSISKNEYIIGRVIAIVGAVFCIIAILAFGFRNKIKQKRKFIRSASSVLMCIITAFSFLLLTFGVSVVLGHMNKGMLKSQISNNGYVTKTIQAMEKDVFVQLGVSNPTEEQIGQLFDDDALYTVFYQSESLALSGKGDQKTDVAEFEKQLKAVYGNTTTADQIQKATAVYRNYMHPTLFVQFHEKSTAYSKYAIVFIVEALLMGAFAILSLLKMYHYRRHANKRLVPAIVAGVVLTTAYILFTFISGMNYVVGIENDFYQPLLRKLTLSGGYVSLIVLGIEVVLLCITLFSQKKRKRAD